MNISKSYFRQWQFNPAVEILSGILVAIALIPEAIGFSVIAGVDPKVGLYGSVIIACVIAFSGGRPAMISAATASTSVLMADIVHANGVQYLFAATILMGILQIIAGILKLGRLMRFVSQSVITGFVNALAILILLAQIPQLTSVPLTTYGLVCLALVIIYGFPYITRAVPSPLVAIAILTLITTILHIDVRTISDLGQFPSTLPTFGLPKVPLNFATLRIIAPVSMALAAVGLLESLLTAQIIDDMTSTTSEKNHECGGQGIANIISAVLGGMGGCAMIGQSVINVSSGGRGRLSTLIAGVALFFLLAILQKLLSVVPVAALTGVMIMVAVNTFSWRSLRNLPTLPWQSTTVMLVTAGIGLATGDLAKGVLSGVMLSGILVVQKLYGRTKFTSVLSGDNLVRTYFIDGQLFFASAASFVDSIDLTEDLPQIIVDFTNGQILDITAVSAVDRVLTNARRRNRNIQLVGLSGANKTMMERFSHLSGYRIVQSGNGFVLQTTPY
jgi:SulP family sulfate permease